MDKVNKLCINSISVSLYRCLSANKGMTEYSDHFANLNELMDLGINHLCLLVSKGETTQYYMPLD